MPAPLVVSIPHSLGRDEAMRRLKTGLSRAASSVPVLHVDEELWEDNRMVFRVRALGQAAAGHVDVEDDHVKVEVVLPWLLQRFAEVAQAAIRHPSGNLRRATMKTALVCVACWPCTLKVIVAGTTMYALSPVMALCSGSPSVTK